MSREARGEQLLDVAEQLFAEHGYTAMTMEDVARGAEVSRPVVYEHLVAKEAAYLACVERARDEYNSRLQEGIDLTATTRAQLTAGAEVFFAMLQDNPGRWLLLFGPSDLPPGPYADQLATLRFSIADGFREVLRLNAGEMAEWRLDACAQASTGIGERLGLWWLRHPEVSRAELVDVLVDVTWNGLGPHFPTERPQE